MNQTLVHANTNGADQPMHPRSLISAFGIHSLEGIKPKFLYSSYDKCSKVLKTNCLPKRTRQTVQTQIRLLPKKQSDQGLPCLLSQQEC